MKRRIIFAVCFLLLIPMFSISASAEFGDSFNRIYKESGAVSTVFSRECFAARRQVSAAALGLENAFEGLNDIYAAKNGNIYILTSDVSKIIVLNNDYTLAKEIRITDKNGDSVDISGARGIYADEDGTIYVADTMNEQILKLDAAGKILLSLTLPDSEIIPEGFFYQPIKIVRDADGYTYVLSEGCYYGALMYSPDNVFEGFIGANKVEATALDAIANIMETLFSSNEKKAASVKSLPYSFLDFSIDSEGYIVTCTGSTSTTSNGKGQIRKINQSGANILYITDTNGDATSSGTFNFLEQKVFKKNNIPQRQNIVAVDIDEDGYIYALEQTYGLVYVFDSDCNLIAGFGGGEGNGEKLGLFSKPVSLAIHGDSVLVADTTEQAITVFELTDFGKILKQADSLYIKGNYDDAAKLWEKVLKSDRGNQLAYRGLAMTAYNKGDYQEALSLAKQGYDYSVYDMAYQRLFTDFIARHFVLIFISFALIAGVLIYAIVTVKHKKLALIQNAKLKTALSVGIHPFKSFEEIKHFQKGSMKIAVVITGLFFIGAVLQATCSGFLYLKQSPDSYNILYTLAQTVGLVLLWSVSNWLISTLISGKGKIKDIFIGTMYALLPYILFLWISFAFSWFLPLSAMGIVSGAQTAVLIYTAFLLTVAMMQIHEYDFFRFLFTVILTAFAMLFVVFLLFMIIILIQQFWNLLYAIFNELVYR